MTHTTDTQRGADGGEGLRVTNAMADAAKHRPITLPPAPRLPEKQLCWACNQHWPCTTTVLADEVKRLTGRLAATERVVEAASRVVDDALMSALSGKPQFPGYIDQLQDALTAYATAKRSEG